jgi:hypothetical protein
VLLVVHKVLKVQRERKVLKALLLAWLVLKEVRELAEL